MTEEQVTRLREIGVRFSKVEIWYSHFEEVKSYFEEHNTHRIPFDFVSESGIKLYEWLNSQKKYYRKGKLSAEKTEKLRSIGVEL